MAVDLIFSLPKRSLTWFIHDLAGVCRSFSSKNERFNTFTWKGTTAICIGITGNPCEWCLRVHSTFCSKRDLLVPDYIYKCMSIKTNMLKISKNDQKQV